ncbi:MAG: DUF433 domain-containing protein [Planctomycetota bacterium]
MAVPKPLIVVDPEIMSGTPVFAGSRVPVQTLLDYLIAGDPIDRFLDHFPPLTREHAAAILRAGVAALIRDAGPARPLRTPAARRKTRGIRGADRCRRRVGGGS